MEYNPLKEEMVAFQASQVRCVDLVRGKHSRMQPLCRCSWFKPQVIKFRNHQPQLLT